MLSVVRQLGTVSLLALSASALAVTAVDEEKSNGERSNPFSHITERNVFGLKPAPPPAPEKAPDPAPVVPLAKVVLTGILNVLGPPRALFEVVENEPGKQPNTKKPILREGEREGPIEVISIDIAKSIVRIKNGNIETNVTFEALKQGGGPALAGGAPPPPPPVPALNMPAPAPAMNTSAIVPTSSRNGRGVVLAGGDPAPASTGNTTASMLAMGGASPNYGSAMQFPSRPIRTSQPQAQQPQETPDPALQYIQMQAQRQDFEKRNIPLPPALPVPGLDDAPQAPAPQHQNVPNGPPGFAPLPPFPR